MSTSCLSRSVLEKTINISQSFQNSEWEKKALPCGNVLKGVIGVHENLGEKFFWERENFTVWISSNRYTTKVNEDLKVISQWRLWHVIEKKEWTISLQKYLNRFDFHIVETLNKEIIFIRKEIILSFQSAKNTQKSGSGPVYMEVGDPRWVR